MQALDCLHWSNNVTSSLQGRMIYKDECIRCFCTPKSVNGLNVCLTCFQGSCCTESSSEGLNSDHTQMHFENTKSSENDIHPIYLNIKMYINKWR